MASWELVPCLVQLRTELNALCPNRDKGSDGTIGDKAHQEHVSDHNDDEVGKVPIRDADSKHEVHAVDLDVDLREPGLTMEKVVQYLVGRCRVGKEDRLRYVIYDGRIWEASRGWVQRTYSGANPHDKHAHFSASYVSSKESDTRKWELEDIPMALTDSDKEWIKAQIDAVPSKTWGFKLTRPTGEKDSEGKPKTTSAGDYQRWNDIVAKNTSDRVIEWIKANLLPR